MSLACPAPSPDLGVIGSVLTAVDCNVRSFSQSGYAALTSQQSFFPTAVTALLTIYVAILGLRLMFGLGSARLADSPMIALKIGVILALSLNWTAFQTLVFDLATKAPLEVARTISAPTARGQSLAGDPIRGVQLAYDQLTMAASAFGREAGPNPQVLRGGEAAAADGLWKASAVMFMSTAGALSIAIIAVGVLLTVGPVFIALALFEATRGLFVGWMRALVSAALAPMVCWMTTTVMLVVLEPWLTRLARSRVSGLLDIDAATATIALVFVFAAAQAAVVGGAAVIGAGFDLRVGARRSEPPAQPMASKADTGAELLVLSRVERLAFQLARAPAAGQTAGGGAYEARLVRGRDGASGGAGREAVSGPIGEVYRRDGFRDRFRRGQGSNS